MRVVHSGWQSVGPILALSAIFSAGGLAVAVSAAKTGEVAQVFIAFLLLFLSGLMMRSVAFVADRWIVRNPSFGWPVERASVLDVRQERNFVCVLSNGAWRRVALIAFSAYANDDRSGVTAEARLRSALSRGR